MKRFLCLWGAIFVLAEPPVRAFAGTCALCRQTLESGGNQGLVQGFYWSILLIAGVPLGIFSAVALAIWRSRRRSNRL
jgi:hypothetical protein